MWVTEFKNLRTDLMKLKPVFKHLNSSAVFVLTQWPSIFSQLCKPLLWKFVLSISQKAKTMNVFCFMQITKDLCMLVSVDFIPGTKSKEREFQTLRCLRDLSTHYYSFHLDFCYWWSCQSKPSVPPTQSIQTKLRQLALPRQCACNDDTWWSTTKPVPASSNNFLAC